MPANTFKYGAPDMQKKIFFSILCTNKTANFFKQIMFEQISNCLYI